ncbi:SMR domain-containing protein At5g58720-like [Salvia splendens]|uniref:SMR domain-containing protein At5g58720-like n=1 Tax=Salvia splendens TaxID=180675 RepID=UPI001C2615F1|nr:SMR domain-containing protein At5g58720-like [Salvia splendens]XP_042042977.1 SMR domain-containing protein At5g58720-like [Salvia splendens]
MTSRKKKSRAARNGNAETHAKRSGENGQKSEKNAVEAFASMSLGEAPIRAAEIPEKAAVMEDQSTTCSSSNGSYEMGSCSSSSSNASDMFGLGNGFRQEEELKQKSRPKMKRVVATSGTVSNMLGKDYVRSVPKREAWKSNGFLEENWSKEAELFLCSMLGDDCELSMAVVSDVLCQCGNNLDKALDTLLELSASSNEQPGGYYESTSSESSENVIDGTSDSTYRSAFVEPGNVWFSGDLFWDDPKFPQSSGSRCKSEKVVKEAELPQKVLQSLFNMPTPKEAEQEPNKMNWRNIVKKMVSLGQGSKDENEQQQQHIHAQGDEYHVLRETAHEHWDSMKSYYQKAVTAYSSGERGYASYLSEQGKLQNKKAQEADVKASRDIFAARNKNIENMITIDLHGQHIKQAMKVLKLHLLFGAYVRSVKVFRVITGCGSHGVGKSKLKTSVIGLLQKEGIKWSEENRGTLLVRLEGQTDFSFLDSGSGSDGD